MRRSALPLVLLAVLCATTAARADCDPSGLVLFPAPGSVIPTNAVIVLEGLGDDGAKVGRLVGRSLALRSEADSVSLKVVHGWQSMVNREAVILKPVHPLKPNQTYFLDPRALGNDPVWRNGPRHGNPSWRTGPSGDDQAPRWQKRPEVAEGEVGVRDGKVVRNVTVHAVVTDQSPVYLVISLQPLRGGSGAQVYFTPLDGSEAVIGHDGCTGSFALEDNGSYRATAKAVDVTGKSSRPATFGFQSPGQKR